jgi:hypothetical protein
VIQDGKERLISRIHTEVYIKNGCGGTILVAHPDRSADPMWMLMQKSWENMAHMPENSIDNI